MTTDRKIVAVLGMMCSACAANVEKKLNGMNGVLQASVNLPGRTVMVEYDKDRTSLQHMKEALDAIGYDMVVEEDRNVEAIERRGYVTLRWKVILSWTFAFLVMTFSMQLLHVPRPSADQICLIIALFNLIYCGRQFYQNAWRQLLHGSANMDTLVALSTGVSFLFSAFNTFLNIRNCFVGAGCILFKCKQPGLYNIHVRTDCIINQIIIYFLFLTMLYSQLQKLDLLFVLLDIHIHDNGFKVYRFCASSLDPSKTGITAVSVNNTSVGKSNSGLTLSNQCDIFLCFLNGLRIALIDEGFNDTVVVFAGKLFQRIHTVLGAISCDPGSNSIILIIVVKGIQTNTINRIR